MGRVSGAAGMAWAPLVLLALASALAFTPLLAAAGDPAATTAATVRYRVVRLWVWSSPAQGYVVDSEYFGGSLYILAVENGIPIVYALNASNGLGLWNTPIKVAGYEPLDLWVGGEEVIVAASPGGEGSLALYKVDRSGASLYANITLDKGLYRILACQILSPTTVLIGGSRFTADKGLQYFAALATIAGVEWSNYTGGPGSEYFNMVSAAPGGPACLSGPQGLLACYDVNGRLSYNTTLNVKPLALKALPGEGGVVVAGVYRDWGVVELLRGGRLAWRVNLTTIVPTALDSADGRVYVAGVTVPKPYRLALAVITLDGEVEVVGLGSESHSDLLPSSLAVGEGSTVIVSGRLDGRPFSEALLLQPLPATTGNTTTSSPEATQPPALKAFYASVAALAGAIAALAIVATRVLKARRSKST